MWTFDGETLRRLKKDGELEEFTSEQFMDEIELKEGRNEDGTRKKAIVLMPGGERSVSGELNRRDAKIIELEERLKKCH